MFSRASLKPCILFKLLFRRRSDHSSGQVFIAMVGTVRPGKNIRAARHCFEKWYDEGKADESAAFWSRFAQNVMHHLVWPAVRAGEITQAPNALVDNPTWWKEGIAPIFEDERVYMLHWKGGRRSGRRCRQSGNGGGVRRRRKHGFKNRHAGVARGVSSSQKQRT